MSVLELKEESGLSVNRAEDRVANLELHGLSLPGVYYHSRFTTQNETRHSCELIT